jgi:hypothetical protein
MLMAWLDLSTFKKLTNLWNSYRKLTTLYYNYYAMKEIGIFNDRKLIYQRHALYVNWANLN